MTAGMEELFKAIFAVAMFVCVCGLTRLALLARLDVRLKLAAGAFLALMLLPTAYLYLRLAFPAAAAALLPFQSMAIWMYGPLLLAVLHVTANRRMPGWEIAAGAMPLLAALTASLVLHARGSRLPDWWELLSLAQGLLFAALALTWTIRARAQLQVVLQGFSHTSFGAMLYLSAGLLALLLADFVVHWRLYTGVPLGEFAFYLLVTPCAVYALIVSMVLIWRPASDTPAVEELAMPAPAPVPFQVRNLELSPAAARELELHLNTLMREQRLFTRNDLTLVDLARALRVSTHLASELLNAHLHTNFYEFLNRHRADEAATLLRAGKGKFSIANIAFQAGFNNPNTFYREFKRAHGVTPAQFRRSDVTLRPPSAESSQLRS
jgi:AraC-like DNA-binding protein